MTPLNKVRAVCFDWGGTLMHDTGGPALLPMVDWPRVDGVDGAADCVRALAGRLPLAIATNAGDSTPWQIRQALARVDIAPEAFAHCFSYTELRCFKSDARFWHTVSERLGLPLEHIAMIGDSWSQDVVAPRAMGVQAVWFNPARRSAPGPDDLPQVDSLLTFAQWVLSAVDSP